VVVLVGLIVAAYVAQLRFPGLIAGALSADAIRQGRWWVLFTHMALHGGFVHLFFNMTALWQLGSVLQPAFGRDLRGAGVFLGLFLVCGLAGGVTFALVNPTGVAVGASGAICGLWGALARLSPPGTLRGAFIGPSARGFIVMNAVLVVLGFVLSGLQSAGVAWEAHVGGYIAGALLILPALRLAGRPWD